MTLNEYFDKIFIINLARRPDRWEHAQKQCEQHGIVAERFDAHDPGPACGNEGCTGSHRMLNEFIARNGWKRTLIFEDDFEARFEDVQQRFSDMVGEVPSDWFMLFLGGHYGGPPKARVSSHVIRFNYMKTTSSYGVTAEAAKAIADHIPPGCTGAIDDLLYTFHATRPCYIFQPRLFVQYNNYSDLQQCQMNNGPCMEDNNHENMV